MLKLYHHRLDMIEKGFIVHYIGANAPTKNRHMLYCLIALNDLIQEQTIDNWTFRMYF